MHRFVALVVLCGKKSNARKHIFQSLNDCSNCWKNKQAVLALCIDKQRHLPWHCIGWMPCKMIKRFIVVMNFFLGVLVIVTWLLQEQRGKIDGHSSKENFINVLLLLAFWGTPFTLFPKTRKKR